MHDSARPVVESEKVCALIFPLFWRECHGLHCWPSNLR